jgi:hypothetical protein
MLLRISEFIENQLRVGHTSLIRVNKITFMPTANTVCRSDSKEHHYAARVPYHALHRCPLCMRNLLVHIFTTLLGSINWHTLRPQ